MAIVNKRLTVHEIFTQVGEAKTRAEKVEILQKYNELAIRDILKGSFDDTIEFIIPKGIPPYQEALDHEAGNIRNKRTKVFRYFAKGGPGERMARVKVEGMFIKLLESVHKEDAKIVIAMKDKKLQGMYKGLTKKAVQEAFPTLISK